MRQLPLRQLILGSILLVSLDGCSWIPFLHTSNGPSYEDAKILKPLAVPPDLLAATPSPGATIPGGAVTAGEVASQVGGTAATQGGYAVFAPRLAPGQSPVKENLIPGAQSQIVGQGAALSLQTSASADQIWSAVQAVLAAEKIGVKQFSPDQGMLVTDWQATRSGITALFGSTLAPNHRLKYTFRLQKAESGNTLSLSQERLFNNPTGEEIHWTKVTADASRNRHLLEAVQKRLSESVLMAKMPEIKVTRYRDDQGPYLVLNQAPAVANQPVQLALSTLGHPVRSEGTGVWVVQLHGGANSSASKGILGGMFTRAWHSIESIWSSPEQAKPLAVRVQLLAMKDDEGSVLETSPTSASSVEAGQRAASKVLDQLQSALTAKGGAS